MANKNWNPLGIGELEYPPNNPKIQLLNAFSVNMISEFPATVGFIEINLEYARAVLSCGFISAIGHSGTAQVLSEKLGLQVECDRITICLDSGAMAIVAQVNLPRLAEGEVLTTEQVADASVRFFLVTVKR